jgi:hypothetical protein
MRQRFRQILLAAAVAGAVAGVSGAAQAAETSTVNGPITWISADSVEVAGRRGILAQGSDIRSDEHTVSWTSIRLGMPASMETDSAGRVLELRVTGVVE